ncbi:phosphopantetheine-binding protein [Streptomyces sp. NPDC006265]|uniref:phosphopantetheine-binding protein n=1 Tax=Streptomyces sp. NPDC006265 TaxID=3156740 RepID=UPI0033B415F1
MDADLKTLTEQRVAAIWAEVLGLDSIGRDQDFFDIGGDSLLATKVVLQLRRVWKARFTVRLLLDAPVLKDLADRIDLMVADVVDGEGGADTAPARHTETCEPT